MTITEPYTGTSGVPYIFEYHDTDSFDSLPYEFCKQVRAVCFCGDKIVVGYGGKTVGAWGLIGGTVEKGETFDQTLEREIQEESNMEVLSHIPVGYQKMTDTRNGSFVYQLRYVCLVRPYGPFISDPAGSIEKIELINPVDYKKYFNWGKIGERIMKRALTFKSKLKS